MTPEQTTSNGDPMKDQKTVAEAQKEVVAVAAKTQAEKDAKTQEVKQEARDIEARRQAVLGGGADKRTDLQINVVYAKMKGLISEVLPVQPKVKLLAEKLSNYPTAKSAAALIPLLKKYIDNPDLDIVFSAPGQAQSSFEQDMQSIRDQDPLAYNSIVQALRESPATFNITEDSIGEKFSVESKGAAQYIADSQWSAQSAERDKLVEEILSACDSDKVPDEKKEEVKNDIFNALRKHNLSEVKEKLRAANILWNDGQIQKLIDFDIQAIADNSPAERQHNNDELKKYNISREDLESISSQTIADHFDEYFTDGNNNAVIQDKFKDLLLEKMYSSVNKLLSRAGENPDAEWDKVYGLYYEQSMERIISSRINRITEENPILKQKLLSMGIYAKVRSFISQVQQEMAGEIEMREAYHSARNYMNKGQLEPEKLADYVKRFPASKISQIAQGHQGYLFELTQSEFERDLQMRIVNNGNTLPADLFANYFNTKERGGSKDAERLKDNLMRRIRDEKTQADLLFQKVNAEGLEKIVDKEVAEEIKDINAEPLLSQTMKDSLIEIAKKQKKTSLKKLLDARRELARALSQENYWEIDRSIVLATGVSLLNTLRAHEIMAMGNIREDFKDIYPFAQYFNLRNRWKMGRGGEVAGGFRIPELFSLQIDMKGEKSFFERVSKGWVPRELYDKIYKKKMHISDLVQILDDEILNKPDPETGLRFGEVLQNFSIFGFFSRGGWRFQAFNDWFKDEFGMQAADNWQISYELMQKYVGASARWFFDEKRAEAEIKDLFFKTKYGNTYKIEMDKTRIDNLFAWYREGKGLEEKVIPITEHGKKENITINEFIEKKTLTYRGRNFLALLERSPYDYLMNMSQLEPKLMDVINATTKDGKKQSMSAFEFYFLHKTSDFIEADGNTREQFLTRLHGRWGAENIKHLEKVAQSWHRIYKELGKDKDGNPLQKKDGKPIDEAGKRDYVYQFMSSAVEKVKMENKVMMTADDIADQNVAHIFFDENGIVPYMHNLHEEFADNPGQEGELGSEGFFRQTAHLWWDLDHPNLLPNSNDMKQLPFFQAVAVGSGETIYSRLWNDVAGWNKTVAQLMNLDTILMDTAKSKKMDKIMELHASIFQLKGFIGPDKAQQLNYILAQATIRYFQEHFLNRMPLPFNILMPLSAGVGKGISLSVLHQSYEAWTWKEEEIRHYIHEMLTSDQISEQMAHQLERAIGADTEKYFLLQAGPTMSVVLLYIMIATMIQKANKEENEPKK